MYQYDRFVEESEFCLLDTSQTPPVRWWVNGFIPLTRLDTQEWKTITGVPGVPIATDIEKGAYYVSKDGTVRLQSPNVPKGDILVAPTVAVFRKFTPTEKHSED
jgi:hypothetical protein